MICNASITVDLIVTYTTRLGVVRRILAHGSLLPQHFRLLVQHIIITLLSGAEGVRRNLCSLSQADGSCDLCHARCEFVINFVSP